MSKGLYPVYRVPAIADLNADLTKPPWQHAPWSPRFVDMVTGKPGWFDTRAAMLWSDTHLYAAFQVEEPFVEAALTERDSLIFLENDIELFIDAGDAYYELELNALGTLYEVLFVWQDALHRYPELNPLQRRACTFGGDYDRTGAHFWRGTHARGLRWAFLDWDMAGLQTAVRVDGTLNDASDIDRGWSVEIAIPWASLACLSLDRTVPPKDGDEWRFFLGRFEKLDAGGVEVHPHPAWCWTPHGMLDTHQPEKWTAVRFSERELPQ